MSANSIEHDEWDGILAELCAGYDKPLTQERRDAYRASLGKIGLVAWRRLVDHCLGPQGPEKFPTTWKLWEIHRSFKQQGRQQDAFVDPAHERISTWARRANLIMFVVVYGQPRRGFRPVGEDVLGDLLLKKREIVRMAEEDERAGNGWSPEEFVDICRSAFERTIGLEQQDATA